MKYNKTNARKGLNCDARICVRGFACWTYAELKCGRKQSETHKTEIESARVEKRTEKKIIERMKWNERTLTHTNK